MQLISFPSCQGKEVQNLKNNKLNLVSDQVLRSTSTVQQDFIRDSFDSNHCMKVRQCVGNLSKQGACRNHDLLPAPGPPVLAAGKVTQGFLQLDVESLQSREIPLSSLGSVLSCLTTVKNVFLIFSYNTLFHFMTISHILPLCTSARSLAPPSW